MFCRNLFFFVIIALCPALSGAQENQRLDSLYQFLDKAKDETLDFEERYQFVEKAYNIAIELDNDVLLLSAGRPKAYILLNIDRYEEYTSQNQKNLELAYKLADSSAIIVATTNLASYYRYTEENDSAYYYYNTALKFMDPNRPTEVKADAYYIMADVQHVAKLYEGAEVDAIKAITILDQLETTEERLDMYWGIYNLLAIIAGELGDYEKAIDYYTQSLEYSSKISEAKLNEVYTLNNIAEVYRKSGQYEKALKIFEELATREADYMESDPSFKGSVIQNIALTKLDRGDYEFVLLERDFKRAKADALLNEFNRGILTNNLDLSRLYLENNYPDSVRKYASEALKLAEDFSSNEAKQRALMLLSEVTPGEQGKAYLKEHIRLGDSLEAEERLVRNKIARIKFDTDQLQARNEQISRENFYLLLVSIVLLLSGILIYVIFTQRARNKELRLKQVQQEANEEIYNLMLKQQDKIEEARALEKTRVSKELHDGVLGRLFGVRLSLDSLNFTEGKDAATNRSRYVSQLKTIEEDIRKISHEMNTDFVSGSGFVDVLKELVDTQAKAYGLDAEFTASEEVNWERVSNKVKINLYRIVQESMQNIYKHAKATKMSVAISLLNDDICLEVSDNGKGFDTSRQRRGIGLKNITSRVKDLKGSVVFESKSGKGTTVRVFLPQERV